MNPDDLEQKLAFIDELQSSCTNCGLCSEVCGTYQATGWEQESPRGRIRLTRDFIHGHIDPSSKALETFDRCLGCKACQLACPSNVEYGKMRELVQDVRNILNPKKKPISLLNGYKKWVKTAYRIGSWRWRAYGSRWISWPLQSQSSFLYTKKITTTSKEVIKLAVSCVQDIYQHRYINDVLILLGKLGYQVEWDKKQPCCGAILERLSQMDPEITSNSTQESKIKSYQKERVETFKNWLTSSTYFLSSDCKCFVKQHIHANDSLLLDVHGLILNKVKQDNLKFVLESPLKIYYQPYCSGFKQEDVAKKLLDHIENLHIQYMPSPFACCGGYCYESVWNPEHAATLLQSKLDAIPLGSIVCVTSADCFNQMTLHGAGKIEVLYPLQILLRAF